MDACPGRRPRPRAGRGRGPGARNSCGLDRRDERPRSLVEPLPLLRNHRPRCAARADRRIRARWPRPTTAAVRLAEVFAEKLPATWLEIARTIGLGRRFRRRRLRSADPARLRDGRRRRRIPRLAERAGPQRAPSFTAFIDRHHPEMAAELAQLQRDPGLARRQPARLGARQRRAGAAARAARPARHGRQEEGLHLLDHRQLPPHPLELGVRSQRILLHRLGQPASEAPRHVVHRVQQGRRPRRQPVAPVGAQRVERRAARRPPT